jgi:hypothetical protein
MMPQYQTAAESVHTLDAKTAQKFAEKCGNNRFIFACGSVSGPRQKTNPLKGKQDPCQLWNASEEPFCLLFAPIKTRRSPGMTDFRLP